MRQTLVKWGTAQAVNLNFSLINGCLSFRRSRDLRMVRTLLNLFTFVDPKRESQETVPDRSKLPDRVPEETVLKVKRRRLSAPRKGEGRGVAGRIFTILPVCAERGCCGGRHGTCLFQPIPLPVFLQFWGFGNSHILFFSYLFFFPFGTFALNCQPSCRGSPTHRQTQRTASRTMRAAKPEEIPTMATIPGRKSERRHFVTAVCFRPRHVFLPM